MAPTSSPSSVYLASETEIPLQLYEINEHWTVGMSDITHLDGVNEYLGYTYICSIKVGVI